MESQKICMKNCPNKISSDGRYCLEKCAYSFRFNVYENETLCVGDCDNTSMSYDNLFCLEECKGNYSFEDYDNPGICYDKCNSKMSSDERYC